MISKQRIITAAATFAIAGMAGFLMQNGDALAARFSINTADVSNSSIQNDQLQTGVMAALPPLPIDMVMPTAFQPDPHQGSDRYIASMNAFPGETLADTPTPMFFTGDCDVNLDVLPMDNGMVSLELKAPCYQNQRIEISHARLEYADVTNFDGSYSVIMPAITNYDPFQVTFADGRSVDAQTLMLDLGGVDRVAVTWSGQNGLHIHALENGAEFDGPGHVWANAPNVPSSNSGLAHGYLITLGSKDVFAPKYAEIYSFPHSEGSSDMGVEILLEAAVDDNSCGTKLTGTAIQVIAGGETTFDDLELNFPACDGENGFLVLNNLFKDLKIARN